MLTQIFQKFLFLFRSLDGAHIRDSRNGRKLRYYFIIGTSRRCGKVSLGFISDESLKLSMIQSPAACMFRHPNVSA